MPWVMSLWNMSFFENSASTCAGFASPDAAANNSMSREASVLDRLASSPIEISSKVRFRAALPWPQTLIQPKAVRAASAPAASSTISVVISS